MNERQRNLYEIANTSLKLGSIGFGGIAGMVSLMEEELVNKKGWVTRAHFLDVVGTANIIPGPNSVEILMHCAREKGGRAGLVVAGIAYILPAMCLCLLYAGLYTRYGQLPAVEPFVYGIRPATTAIIFSAVLRLSQDITKRTDVLLLSLLVFAGALLGLNDLVLLFAAGVAGALYRNRGQLSAWLPLPLLFVDGAGGRLFLQFLKIGAILYGSGYVLFAYMDDALVQQHHWLTRQQLTDAISVGQITPGPILSSATFAGYLIGGLWGGILSTIAIFLPSFFISLFLFRLLRFINRHQMLRSFLDMVNAASVALIAAVAATMTRGFLYDRRSLVLLAAALVLTTRFKVSPAVLVLFGSIAGWLLTWWR